MMGRMAHAVPTEAGAGTAVFTATVLDALTSANKPQVMNGKPISETACCPNLFLIAGVTNLQQNRIERVVLSREESFFQLYLIM